MNYLPSSTRKIIFFISLALAAVVALAITASGGNGDFNLATMLWVFIAWLAILYIGGYLVCFIIQLITNGVQRDKMKTEIMKDEYYRMEARKRLDRKDL